MMMKSLRMFLKKILWPTLKVNKKNRKNILPKFKKCLSNKTPQ